MTEALTVRALIALYQRHSQANGVHCPEARESREHVFRLFVKSCGRVKVDALKRYHLTDFVEAHPEWQSSATRRSKANMIRAVFQWAYDDERIDRNPFKGVRYTEADRRPEMPDPTLARLQRLGNKRWERAVRFLRLTGCRLAELCAALWPDMDLEVGVWTIPAHKSRKYTRKPKKVALVAEAVSLVRESKEDAMPTQRHVFVNNRGTPWTRRTLGQQLLRMKTRHGIDTPASLHGIRHRFAGQAVANGAPLKLIAAQLGHSSVAVTERYYCDLSDQMDAIRAAAEKGLPKAG